MITTPRLIQELTTKEDRADAQNIPKHAWIDLYADLYRQTHGEQSEARVILHDAVNRIKTLRANGLL